MLDTEGYKHTLRICNTVIIALPLQKWLKHKRLIVTLHYFTCLFHSFVKNTNYFKTNFIQENSSFETLENINFFLFSVFDNTYINSRNLDYDKKR